MALEIPFRVALVIVVVPTITVGIYYRLQAAASGEKIDHKDEGYLFAIILRLTGLSLWIATLAYLIFPASVHWATFPVHPSVRWIGVVIGIGCSVLMYWTLSSLGKNLTDTVVTRANATLVTHGPYHYAEFRIMPRRPESSLEKPRIDMGNAA